MKSDFYYGNRDTFRVRMTSGEKVSQIRMTCQTGYWAMGCLETSFIQRNCTMTGLRIPYTVAHCQYRCSSRCACIPGPPEVEVDTILCWTVPGESVGQGLSRGWPGIRERCRGVPACPQPRRSAGRIWPAADRLNQAACARVSPRGCKVPGCSTASSSW